MGEPPTRQLLACAVKNVFTNIPVSILNIDEELLELSGQTALAQMHHNREARTELENCKTLQQQI